jgi:predicted nucleic acid-binding protein
MTPGLVVCNASPLIALEQIGQLELLRHLFGRVLVPPAVVRETGAALVILHRSAPVQESLDGRRRSAVSAAIAQP